MLQIFAGWVYISVAYTCRAASQCYEYNTDRCVTPLAKLGEGQHDALLVIRLLYTLKYVSHSKEAVSSVFVSGR